jgi:hypothetical protein
LIHPRDYMKLVLFYSQAIALDAATPGKVAKERLLMNARLLRETAENWCSYAGWKPKELMKEVGHDDRR